MNRRARHQQLNALKKNARAKYRPFFPGDMVEIERRVIAFAIEAGQATNRLLRFQGAPTGRAVRVYDLHPLHPWRF